jgi:hypothetical protein
MAVDKAGLGQRSSAEDIQHNRLAISGVDHQQNAKGQATADGSGGGHLALGKAKDDETVPTPAEMGIVG